MTMNLYNMNLSHLCLCVIVIGDEDDTATSAVDRDSNSAGGDDGLECADTTYGCCLDGVTTATDRTQSNCPGMSHHH